MRLVFTHYVDSSPAAVKDGLDQAVSAGLDAAVELMSENRDETQTEQIEHGLRVNGGMRVLNGSEIRISGTRRLTTIETSVPWSVEDKDGLKLRAANRFATVIADNVRVAA